MAIKRSRRRGMSGPTIHDVASCAGVSPMTVSRVLDNSAAVRPKTRERVEAAIAELGYVRNASARGLARGCQSRIALIYSNPSAGYLSELLLGTLAAARDSNIELLIESYEGGDLAKRLITHRIDGVLLPAPTCDEADLVAKLRSSGMEIVQIASGRPSIDAHAIAIDDRAAAHAMTAHLLRLGHRRIAFIEGNSNQTASALRREGYLDALLEAGVAHDPDLERQGDFSFHSGLAAAEHLLALSVPPTAIFASNDDMAAAAINVAHRLGLDVPKDVTICGYDDTAVARTLWPELTTIRQPVAAMARTALEMLVEAIQGDNGARMDVRSHQRIDFELIVRQSDAPPPTGR